MLTDIERLSLGCAIVSGMVDLPAPPSGTVTFLFTDVVGSTQLREKDPGFETRLGPPGHPHLTDDELMVRVRELLHPLA